MIPDPSSSPQWSGAKYPRDQVDPSVATQPSGARSRIPVTLATAVLVVSLAACIGEPSRGDDCPPPLVYDESWGVLTYDESDQYFERVQAVLDFNPLGLEVAPALEIQAEHTAGSSGGFFLRAQWTGDVDGDGWDDVALLAARGFPSRTFDIYSGKDGRRLSQLSDQPSSPSYFMQTVALGDIDGDGCDDFAVSAFAGQDPIQFPFELDHGRVLVFSGKAGKLLWRREGLDAGLFSFSLADVGDVDGDGARDIAVGSPPAPHKGTIPVATGHVFVLSGRTGATILNVHEDSQELDFGTTVESAGDLNRDGVPDIAIVAQVPRAGWVPSPLASLPKPRMTLVSGRDGSILASSRAEFADSGNRWTEGTCITALHGGFDFDGDGVPDLLSGPWSRDKSAEIRSGADGRVLQRFDHPPIEPYEGNDFGDFGSTVDVIDDIDGDGLPDVLIGQHALALPLGQLACLHVYSSRTGKRVLTYFRDDTCTDFTLARNIVGKRPGDGRVAFLVDMHYGACVYVIRHKSHGAGG